MRNRLTSQERIANPDYNCQALSEVLGGHSVRETEEVRLFANRHRMLWHFSDHLYTSVNRLFVINSDAQRQKQHTTVRCASAYT